MNQVVLITGSAKGIGKAIAFELAQAGYAIVINYRSSKQEALAVQNQIQDMNSVPCLCIQADVSKEA